MNPSVLRSQFHLPSLSNLTTVRPTEPPFPIPFKTVSSLKPPSSASSSLPLSSGTTTILVSRKFAENAPTRSSNTKWSFASEDMEKTLKPSEEEEEDEEEDFAQHFLKGYLKPKGLTMMGAIAVGVLVILMDDQKALALGPEGPLLEEFWENVRRYGLYFLTVSTGAIYTVFQPIAELLKNPVSAVLVITIMGGSIYIVSQVLSAMVGVTEVLADWKERMCPGAMAPPLLPRICLKNCGINQTSRAKSSTGYMNAGDAETPVTCVHDAPCMWGLG